MGAHRLTFGVKTSQMGLSYQEIQRFWIEADQIPLFEHAWLWDHMVPLRGNARGATLEAWTLLSALAAQTSRLKLGVIVTSNRLRPPALLAKMAATVDQVSGGRLVFGIGAGGSVVADASAMEIVRREFQAYGIEIVSAASAIGALAEACSIIRRLWMEEDQFEFVGHFYHLVGAVCEPKPIQKPRPPILIGAGGERLALRVVAEHADIWNFVARTADEYRHKSEVLTSHCEAIGRDPEDIVRSSQIIVSPDDPRDARQQLADLIAVGCTHLVLGVRPPWPAEPATWLVQEVVEPLLERLDAATTTRQGTA